MSDFTISCHGSISLLSPQTEEAQEWVNEYLPDDCQVMGHSIVIEWRYVDDIVCGIVGDGLTVTA